MAADRLDRARASPPRSAIGPARPTDVSHRLCVAVDLEEALGVVGLERSQAEPLGLDRQRGPLGHEGPPQHEVAAGHKGPFTDDDESLPVVERPPASILRVNLDHVRIDPTGEPAVELVEQRAARAGPEMRGIGVDAEQLRAA